MSVEIAGVTRSLTDTMTDREEALRDDFHLETTYDYGEEDEWDDNEADWNGEGEENNEEEPVESKDESKAYLEFLNDEVCDTPTGSHIFMLLKICKLIPFLQAQKYSRAIEDVDDDELGEDSVLLDSPLDKVEPYQLFKATLLSMCHPEPELGRAFESLTMSR